MTKSSASRPNSVSVGTLPDDAPFRIRPQRQPEDLGPLYAFIREAFRTARRSDGREQDFFRGTLMAPGRYLPDLAFVAEDVGGALAGHVMLTRLGDALPLLLAPLSVRADVRGRGLGARLVRHALAAAREAGAGAVALVGDPGYYARFGFRPAAGFGLTSAPPIPAPFLQALPLRPGAEAMLRGVCLPLPE